MRPVKLKAESQHQRVDFLRRRSDFRCFSKCLIDLGVIMRLSDDSDGLAVWAKFYESEWCRNHPKMWSGDRFLYILECDSLRETCLCL